MHACRDAEDRGVDPEDVGVAPKVVEVYQQVGKIMSRYSAGKVPKAFKIIPNLKNWEEVSSTVPGSTCTSLLCLFALHVLAQCNNYSGIRAQLCKFLVVPQYSCGKSGCCMWLQSQL